MNLLNIPKHITKKIIKSTSKKIIKSTGKKAKNLFPNKTNIIKKNLIGVIMPVYNTPAKLFNRAIASVLKNSFKDFKLIIVNDGSTKQKTINVLNKYRQNKYIHIIDTKNIGVNQARQTAISFLQNNIKPNYVCFIDSDDCYFKHTLFQFAKTMQTNKNTDIVIGNYTLDKIQYKNLNNKPHNKELRFERTNLIEGFNWGLWRNCYNIKLFDDIDYSLTYLFVGGDTVLNYQLLLNAQKRIHLNSLIYFYNQRHGSIVNTSETSPHYGNYLSKICDNLIKFVENILVIKFSQNIINFERMIEVKIKIFHNAFFFQANKLAKLNFNYTSQIFTLIKNDLESKSFINLTKIQKVNIINAFYMAIMSGVGKHMIVEQTKYINQLTSVILKNDIKIQSTDTISYNWTSL